MARRIEEDMEIVDDNGESLMLDSRYTNIPLYALRTTARTKISLYLDNTSDIIDEDTGYVTDWNGLAELIGFNNLELKKFGRQKSPTKDLLDDWESAPQCLNYSPTLGNLWKILIELGRIDVIQDCRNIVIKDADNHIRFKERLQSDYLPVQENYISSPSDTPDHYVDETLLLVKDDVEGRVTLFDAFICYNIDSQGKDIAFVKEMINKLEKQYDLKLCVPGRDDLPGGSRYVTEAKLIESRCKRMIIVLSHEYLHSAACDFQVKFAHALAPGARSKKLIPVLIEPSVPIPQILRHVTLCDYTKQDLMEWFWERLAKSVKAPLDQEHPRQNCESSSPVPISSSSSSSVSVSLSPSTSFSTIEKYCMSNSSLRNAQHMLEDENSTVSPDSGFQSSLTNSDESFHLNNLQSTSVVGSNKKDKGRKNIITKIFGKKNNNHTSSQA